MTESDFNVEHFFSEGVYARKMELQPGVFVPTHKHVYDHLSILGQGRVRVWVDDVITEYAAPAMITVKKNQVHKIFALEKSVWYCIHPTEATSPEEVDAQTVVMEN